MSPTDVRIELTGKPKKAGRGRRMEKPEKNGSRKTEKRIKAEADEREKEREVELKRENLCIDERK